MNLYLREMKAHRKSLILWSIGIIFFVAVSIGKYAGMGSSGQSMNELMAEMPKSLRAIMGTGTFDLTKVSGYYGVLVIYLYLMGAIHSAMMGANILAKEERDKTAEFLFVKPISRNKIILSKLFAALTNIFILNLLTAMSCFVLIDKYGNGEKMNDDIFLTMIGLLILQLLFLVVGTAIAAVSKRPKTAASFSTGILLLTFIISIAIDLNEKLESLKYITPFKYFDAKNVMYGGGLDEVFVFISALLIIGLTFITFIFYKKRDLNI